MLQSVSSVFVVYRRKTLTGSPDPMHANGTDKPCTRDIELGAEKVIDPLNPGSVPSSQKLCTTPAPELASTQVAVTTEELHLGDHTEPDNILGGGDCGTSPITSQVEWQLLPIEAANFGFRTPSYHQTRSEDIMKSIFPCTSLQSASQSEVIHKFR